jgi:hypothetical protein
VDEEREEEVEEEGLEGVEENLERGDVVGEGGYLKDERDYQMMAEGDKVAPDQENSKGKKIRIGSLIFKAWLWIRIHFIRIRTQSGSRALMTKNLKKITAEKKIKFLLDQKLQFTYLSLGLHKERPSYRRSLQLSKEAIPHFKT